METLNNTRNFEAESTIEVGHKLLDLLPDGSAESLVVGRYCEILKSEDHWVFWAMFYHDLHKCAQQELRLYKRNADERVSWLAQRYYPKVSHYYANMRDEIRGYRSLDFENYSELERYENSLHDKQHKDILKPEFNLEMKDLMKSLVEHNSTRGFVCEEIDKRQAAIKLLCSGYFKGLSEEDMSYYADSLRNISYVLESIADIATFSGTR